MLDHLALMWDSNRPFKHLKSKATLSETDQNPRFEYSVTAAVRSPSSPEEIVKHSLSRDHLAWEPLSAFSLATPQAGPSIVLGD
jgi:hypothetical protein